jgi:hypothetical protein
MGKDSFSWNANPAMANVELIEDFPRAIPGCFLEVCGHVAYCPALAPTLS